MKMTSRDRIVLLLTTLIASWQVAVGIDDFEALPVAAYTVGFGVLLIAVLLIFILGFDVLDLSIVAVVSTIIPLALSLGLVWQHLAPFRTSYLLFAIVSLLAVTLTRSIKMQSKLPIIVLAVTHGIAGMTIFLLPIILSIQGKVPPLFSLVGVGGALIGVGGLLLFFLKTGKPILSRETILRLFPTLLLLTTVFFAAGFKFG